jgi:glycosyltransferase involved in cell wall biosynthesis
MAKAIIAISKSTKKDLIESYNLPEEKIFVTPLAAGEQYNSLIKDQDKQILNKYHLKLPFILFIGTIEPRKNIQGLIKAFDLLFLQKKINHQLVLIGKKGWKSDPIFDLINKVKSKKKIKYLNFVNDQDLPSFYRSAQVFVYPSFYEGFGLPPLEAMKSGCPVIISKTSSLPEVVGKAGLLVNPQSNNDLVSKIDQVIKDQKLRQKMIQDGLIQAKKFSWQKTASLTLAVYQKY